MSMEFIGTSLTRNRYVLRTYVRTASVIRVYFHFVWPNRLHVTTSKHCRLWFWGLQQSIGTGSYRVFKEQNNQIVFGRPFFRLEFSAYSQHLWFNLNDWQWHGRCPIGVRWHKEISWFDRKLRGNSYETIKYHRDRDRGPRKCHCFAFRMECAICVPGYWNRKPHSANRTILSANKLGESHMPRTWAKLLSQMNSGRPL